VISAPESHATVIEAIHKAGIPTVSAEIAMLPKNLMTVDSKHVAGMLRMLDVLEDHDDVQSVFSNFDYDEDAAGSKAGSAAIRGSRTSSTGSFPL